MFGVHYPGQPYFGQGYAVPGALIPLTERYSIEIYGVDGSLIAKIGDISGLQWGASQFKLPDRTYGLWSKRAGTWANNEVQVFYANADTLTVEISGFAPSTDGKFRFDVDETFPFGRIDVPDGRMVSWEDLLYFTEITLISAPGVTNPSIVAQKTLAPILYAVKDGGTLQAWNFMTGPGTGAGVSSYNYIRLRRGYEVQVDGTAGGAATWTFSIRRISALRFLAHEVNKSPALSPMFVSFTAAATITELSVNTGADKDPLGGNGDENGGYSGDPGGSGGEPPSGGGPSGPVV